MFAFGTTKCSKCGGAIFKTEELVPQGSAYKLVSVQCQSCGTPIGVVDYFNLGTLLKQQEQKLGEMDARLQKIERAIQQIAQVLNRR